LTYSRYAIGEILLVVVGILIALQINNWNEERKLSLEETGILKSVKLDFVNAIKECEENNEFRTRILEATRELYSIMRSKDLNYSKNQLDSIIAVLFINPTYNNQTGSLEVLFNSGKINLIKDLEIKEALMLWPQIIEDIKEDEIYSSEQLRYEFYPFIRKYISIKDVNTQINYKNLKMFEDSISSPFTSDYESLMRNMEFEGILATRELNLSVSLIQTNELIDFAKEIIVLIEDKTK
jgi:hypothetical protein